jgi:O-antigen/teichoic acid export membrane protein
VISTAEGEVPTRFTGAVVRGASFTGLGNIATQAVTLASYVVLARLASPAVFGAFAAAWVVVGVGTFFAESGMSAALIQRNDRLEEAAATAVVSTLIGGVALSVIALGAAPLIGLFFHSREIGLLAAALSGVLFLNAATVVPDALMRRRFSFLRRVIVDPVNALTYGVAGAVGLALGMGAWGLVLATYVAGVVRVVSVWLLNRWIPDLRIASFAMWRELAGYARHVVASTFVRELSAIVNTAVLGRVLGTAALGEYRFGWRLATQAGVPVSSAGTYVLLPAFARMAADLERFRAAFLRSTLVVSALVLPIAFALVPLGEQLTIVLLGDAWRTTGYVLAALAAVAFAMPAMVIAAEVFKAANRPDILPKMSLILTAWTIVLTFAFLPLGVVGVGVGTSLAFLIGASYGFWQVGRVLAFPLRQLATSLLRPALAALGMAMVLGVLALSWDVTDKTLPVQLGWLLAEVSLGLLVYAVLLRFLAPPAAHELRAAMRVLRRKDTHPGSTADGPRRQAEPERPFENKPRTTPNLDARPDEP